MRPLIRLLSTLGLIVALGLGPALAEAALQPLADKAFAAKVVDWTRTLDRARDELAKPQPDEAAFESLRRRVEAVRDEALSAWREAQTQAEGTRKLLEALGPGPKEGEPAEAADVAAQRAALARQLAGFEGRMKQADLVATQASDVLGRFLAARSGRMAERLVVRGPSPLLPTVWAKAVPEFAGTLVQLAAVPLAWIASGDLAGRGLYSLGVLAAGLLLAALIGWPLRKWLLRRFGRTLTAAQPSYVRRVAAAAVEGLARGLLPSLAVGAVYLTFLHLQLLTASVTPIAVGVSVALVFFIMVSSLARAALAPDQPAWQLAPMTAEAARTISRTITAMAAVAAVIIFFHESVDEARIGVEVKTVFNLVTNSMIAAGVLFLMRPSLWRPAPAPLAAAGPEAAEAAAPGELFEVRRRIWPALRVVMAAAALAIPVAAASGYYKISAYLTSSLVWSGALIGGLWLLRELAREVIELLLARDERLSASVRRMLALSERGARILQFWLLFGINLVLIGAGLAFALPIWGVSWQDLSSWLQSSEVGLALERLTFSLGDILAALAIFAGIMIATRWVQRFLEERVLPQTRIDLGVRHSLKAAAGYLGLIVAALAAISSLGLNLTNLALVAGALSVGIGFGLQAIVSNFVSGLILLIERPVKVGDWVVVGDREGFVKRISVRATEIETFQRASVIVPNSEILSKVVVNLTHKDRAGRIDIPVGVAYGSDLDKVRSVLLRCAAEHPEVVKHPRPKVILRNFGDHALELELRAHVDHIEHYWDISSDLRFAIDKAFREAGIQIPFPQTDLHIPDLERLEKLFGARADTPRVSGEAERERAPRKGSL